MANKDGMHATRRQKALKSIVPAKFVEYDNEPQLNDYLKQQDSRNLLPEVNLTTDPA